MQDEDFLAAVEADNEGTPVADVIDTTPAAEPAVEKAAIEPVAEPTVLPAMPEPQPEVQHAPLAALLDERDKRKAAEQELARFRAQQPQQQPQAAPDPIDDPEGYSSFQDQKVQQALYATNLQWSERIATIQHGGETVTKAKEWGITRCDADPYFNAKVAASPDPVGFVVSEWKRDQIASNVNDTDYEQFLAWKTAQAQIQQPPATGPAPPTSPAIPPRSLASAPSAGTILTEPAQSDEEIFAETFARK